MGNYLNPDNEKFKQALNSEIYVDKTDLIGYTNKVLNTMQRYLMNGIVFSENIKKTIMHRRNISIF